MDTRDKLRGWWYLPLLPIPGGVGVGVCASVDGCADKRSAASHEFYCCRCSCGLDVINSGAEGAGSFFIGIREKGQPDRETSCGFFDLRHKARWTAMRLFGRDPLDRAAPPAYLPKVPSEQHLGSVLCGRSR